MIIKGIHHIGLNSKDASRLVDFYVDVFEFERIMELENWQGNPQVDRMVGGNNTSGLFGILRGKNIYLEIFQYYSPAPSIIGPLEVWDRGFTHICFSVSNIEDAHAKLLSRGMNFISDKWSDYGTFRAVYGRDPDGNLIELIETMSDHHFAFNKLQNQS